MSTTHKITATRSGSHPTMGDWDVDYEITFTYLPGSPDTYDAARGGPGGWDPGRGPEIEFIAITPDAGDHGVFTDLAHADLIDWAKNWLDENAAECAEIAEQNSQPDPDDARQARIDDEMMERDR